MDAQRWAQVRALFEQLVDLDPAAWNERLLAVAPDDPALRTDALAMLQADRVAQQRASRAVADAPALIQDFAERESSRDADAWIGRDLGPWRIERALGQGGMGVVYLAERHDGEYRQQAALKMLRGSASDGNAQARFLAERQMLAGLEHPRIARLLDGGSTPESGPWFALEYVDGTTLLAWCDAQRLGVNERLAVFLDVCAAVAHAHERLIVHRDLKPGNILVDRDGQVKLLDFGIAKLLDVDSAQTGTALRAFTPEYAAPEQVRGERITTAVDVYALGVVLCELLTGRRPYRLAGHTPAAYERAVIEQDASPPSGIVTRRVDSASDAGDDELAQRRRMTPATLRARLRGDLDAIVLKALRKEPELRYRSVRQFADDLQAVLSHRPVAARRGGRRYRAARFLRRNRIATAMAALALLALLGGLGTSLWQAREARDQRDLANAEAAKAKQALGFMAGLFESADPGDSKREEMTVRALLDQGVQDIERSLAGQDAIRGELLLAMASAYLGLELLEPSEPLIAEALSIARAQGDPAAVARASLQECRRLNYQRRNAECASLLDAAEAALDPRIAGHALLGAEIINLRLPGLMNASRYDEAERQAREGLHLLGSAPEHRTLRAILSGVLSRSLAWRGENAEAEAVMTRVVAEIRASGASRPRDLADALDNLGSTIAAPQRASEVAALHREAYELMVSIYGADHPAILTKMGNYALATFRAGDAAAATRLNERVLAIKREHVPPTHPSLANTLAHLGNFAVEAGDDAQAMARLDEALAIYAQAPARSPAEAGALFWRAVLGFAQGDPAGAQRDLAKSQAIFAGALPASHPRLARGHALLVALAMTPGHEATPDCAAARRAATDFAASGEAGGSDARFARVVAEACEARGAERAGVLSTFVSTLPATDFRRRLVARMQGVRALAP